MNREDLIDLTDVKSSSEIIRFIFSECAALLSAKPENAEQIEKIWNSLAFQTQELKALSGQDFGESIRRYAEWFQEHDKDWHEYSTMTYPPEGIMI